MNRCGVSHTPLPHTVEGPGPVGRDGDTDDDGLGGGVTLRDGDPESERDTDGVRLGVTDTDLVLDRLPEGLLPSVPDGVLDGEVDAVAAGEVDTPGEGLADGGDPVHKP